MMYWPSDSEVRYIKAEVWDFPLMTSLSVNKWYVMTSIHFQAKMALAAECTEKELKILKDEVRALHVSTLDNLLV